MLRRFFQAALLVLAFAACGGSPAFAQKSFVRDDLASAQVRLEQQLRTESAAIGGGRPAAQLRREADSAFRADPRRAMSLYAAAVAADPRDAANWFGFVRAARAVTPLNYSERYRLNDRATTAAYAAYQRSSSRPDEAAALVTIAEIYARQESWRSALDAYRASLKLVDNPAIAKTYADLREKHGFRILDYKVDSDSASPRICFQFSEGVQTGKVDFAPYVTVANVENAAVTAEGSQVCVDGLKHGEKYHIGIRQGLPSSVEETLLKSADYEIYVRDRSAQVRFTGRNYVLPRTGQEGIPVVSVNTEKVDVDIYRIGDRSLLPTLQSDTFLAQLTRSSALTIAREKGFKVWTGTLDTKPELNRDVTTAFPVMEAVGKLEAGIYVMTAKAATKPRGGPDGDADDEDYGTRATQWFVVSDLGLTAFKSEAGIHVFARSLSSADPTAKVEIRLVARNNEVLATKTTDSEGHVVFDPGLARGEGGLAPGILVASTAGGDYGFLDLSQSAFDLTDRGVKGRLAPAALDAFLYTERGVYRSGETVHLTALLRDAKGVAAPGLPLTLVAYRPDGVEYRRVQVQDQGIGGRSLSLPLLAGVSRGTWRFAAYVDPKAPPVGQTTFLVEDYVPERLEVTLTPKSPTLRPGEPAIVDIGARYLYGAPGADLEVSGEVVVGGATDSGIKGLEGYEVGLEDEAVEATTAEIEDKGTTDAQGRVTMEIPVQDLAAPRPTQARITLRVGEPGGRAVERDLTLPILPKGPVIGVRKNFDSSLGQGATATFDVVMATPEGSRMARQGVTWSLYKVERNYQWYNRDGSWGYETVRSTKRIADGTLDLKADAHARIAAAVQWGSYRLDVKAPGLDGAETSTSFTVGWSGDATAERPDLLELTLDKASYQSGDTLKATLNARSAGKALVAVVSNTLHEIRLIDVAAGGTSVSVPVKAEWGSGAYLVALAYRPLDQAAKRMPGRALGLAWFGIDAEKRKLEMALNAPAQMRPRGTLSLPIKLAGLTPGEEARVTVAAVDVGILNLTRYEAPEPASFFFGQKQLSTEIRDLYGYLIDGMQGTRGAIRSGGDAASRSLAAIPPTQEPLARYSGVVTVGPDGTAHVDFEIPAFNGTVRVMGVAWTANRVGSASQDVIVRDPVVLAGTMPRFLSVGDRSRFFMQLDNVEAPAGDYTVDIDVHGPVAIPAGSLRQVVRLEKGGKGSLMIPVNAAGPGTAVLDVKLSGDQIPEMSQSFTVKVQPGTAAIVRRTVRPLEPNASLSVSADLLADMLPGTGAVTLSVSPLGDLDVPALLQALDRYPYGCSEQIVSRALPLLYVNKLASEEALALDQNADKRVRDAIERVLTRQSSNGTFGLWSVGGDDIWLDAYVGDFLTRARERNFAVPQKAFDLALERLRNYVANTTDPDGRGEDLAYAAYVLARNGRPVTGDLRYLADTKLSAFRTPLSRAQVAAALAMIGDRGRAETVFRAAIDQLRALHDAGVSRPDYGTRLRDAAGMLALASEANLPGEAIQAISRILQQERAQRGLTSTQENAWLVLAAESLTREADAISLEVDGKPHKGAFYAKYGGPTLDLGPVSVANHGAANAQVVVGVTGSPIGPEPAASRGYTIERSYYKLDGTQVDPAQVRQNERLVVVLKVTEPKALFARVLVVDPLPAGFEIDNPALVTSGTVAALDWLKTEVEPVNTEYRDDRFVAAFERSSGQEAFFSVAYMVRAVAPGRYIHPAASVEDMYRPDRFGRTAFGAVEVTAARNDGSR